MKPFDLAVVGGGLAGLSLACLAADAGKNVVLFEQKTYPFHRVCGEYISNESVPFLQRLGLSLSDLNPAQITQLELSGPNGKTVTGALGLGGFGVSRYRLDLALSQLAKSKGVSMMDGCKVYKIEGRNLDTQKGDFESDTVVFSYGKQSNLETELQNSIPKSKKEYTGVKYHVKGDFPKDRISLHAFNGGYCGFSAVEDDLFCLCYLIKSEKVKSFKGDWESLEASVLAENPNLKLIFSNTEKQWDNPKTISGIHFEIKQAQKDNFVFLGDAAAMIAPLCGNGMSMAFRSADLYFQKGNRYDQAWNGEFKTRLISGRRLQHLFLTPGLANGVVFAAGKSKALFNRLVRQTHGNPW